MNNYEKIKAIINSGHLALCEHINGQKVIYSSIKSKMLAVRRSSYELDVDLCMDSLGATYDAYYEIPDFKSIKPLPCKVPKFNVGDLVEILDVDSAGRSDEQIEMIGKGPFEIRSAAGYNCYFVYNKNKTDFHFFCFNELCLWTGDEKVESITIGGVEYSKAEFEKAVKDLKPLK